MTEVFCRYIRKNGKIIYPKNGGFFHFWIEDEKDPVEAESQPLNNQIRYTSKKHLV